MFMEQDGIDITYKGSLILKESVITGNVRSEKDICLLGGIQGNVCSEGLVIVDKGAVVDGNVECGKLFILGIITGNVCVAGKTIMGTNAEIKGELVTACLEITPGARIGKALKLQ